LMTLYLLSLLSHVSQQAMDIVMLRTIYLFVNENLV
jgi:hypothetical protein